MMAAVRGHYNGSQIVLDENMGLDIGQEVIITVLNMPAKVKQNGVDLRKYMGRGKKMFHSDPQDYVKELRADDRI